MKKYTAYILACLFIGLGAISVCGQAQIAKTSFLNTTSDKFVVLGKESALTLADVYKDQLNIYRLAAGENGYLEVMIDNVASAVFTISLEEEGGGQSFPIAFNNAIATSFGNTANVLNGDFFRIQRCADRVDVYHNNDLLASDPIADNNFALITQLNVLSAELDGLGNMPFASLSFPNITSGCPPPPTMVKDIYYALQKMLDGSYALVEDNTLRFKYTEPYSTEVDNSLSYNIFNANRTIEVNTGMLTKERGVNYFQLNLSLTNLEYYILEVSDAKGLKSYLRFQYRCPVFNGQTLCAN